MKKKYLNIMNACSIYKKNMIKNVRYIESIKSIYINRLCECVCVL